MRRSEFALTMSKLVKDLEEFQLPDNFIATCTDNERADKEHSLYTAMLRFMKANTLRSVAKKWYENSKIDLDHALVQLHEDPEVVENTTKTFYSHQGLSFSKRRNTTSETLNSKKLITALNTLGVDPAVIKKAVEAATETRRGSVYYIVDTDEADGNNN